MSILKLIYSEIIFRPLLNGLVLIYALLPYRDVGLAIVVLTVIVRIILHPALVQTLRSQQAMALIQPRLRDIQKRLKDNKEEQTKQTLALYREFGVHPLSGCVPLLIQLPVLIGLYQVFLRAVAHQDLSLLYHFTASLQFGGAMSPIAFGVFNLAKGSAVLAITAGISQFLQAKFTPQPEIGGQDPTKGGSDATRAIKFQTTYVLPVFIAGISWSLPSALAFYWTVLNLLAIVQQRWIQKRMNHERNSPTHQPNA